MFQTDGKTPVSVVRLYTLAEPDTWCFEDLYLDPAALEPVADLAYQHGLPYDIFGPAVVPENCGYNDAVSGSAYLQHMLKQHRALADGKFPHPPADERRALPPPKGFN